MSFDSVDGPHHYVRSTGEQDFLFLGEFLGVDQGITFQFDNVTELFASVRNLFN